MVHTYVDDKFVVWNDYSLVKGVGFIGLESCSLSKMEWFQVVN